MFVIIVAVIVTFDVVVAVVAVFGVAVVVIVTFDVVVAVVVAVVIAVFGVAVVVSIVVVVFAFNFRERMFPAMKSVDKRLRVMFHSRYFSQQSVHFTVSRNLL